MTYTLDTSRSSPNHASRGGADISMLVLHATVGSGASARSWLTNPASKVSSHYLIYKTGYTYQLVADNRAAWHAGRSAWHGMTATDIEQGSIGIELENANTGRDPYPIAQLDSARQLCKSLIARYQIARVNVVRHLDIAKPPGRKTDPANFPWTAFVRSLYAVPGADMQYRVKKLVTAGATIRDAPRMNGAVLGHLNAGDLWTGEPIEGNMVTLHGFGSNRIWIRASDQRVVWSGLLEKATP
jgi:N-acetyl-anhydromuramyl-L-alanine amidase AmpD